jgi:hypothetical protein
MVSLNFSIGKKRASRPSFHILTKNMKFGSINLFRRGLGICAAAASFLFAGCHTEDERMTMTLEERMQASLPEPPPILSVPVLTLFTNQPGFGAHCRIERIVVAGQKPRPLEGALLHRGSEFLFAAEAQEKKARGREMTFMWDVASNRGHALNDALPGYAPLVARAQLTSVQSTGKAPDEKVDGHPTLREQLTVTLNDGSNSQFTVWRATDLNGLPVRIRTDSGNPRVTIDLTDIRMQEPAAKLFEIPQDFTRYDSPKAMFEELFRRESVTRRGEKPKPVFDEDNFQKTGTMRPYQ